MKTKEAKNKQYLFHAIACKSSTYPEFDSILGVLIVNNSSHLQVVPRKNYFFSFN